MCRLTLTEELANKCHMQRLLGQNECSYKTIWSQQDGSTGKVAHCQPWQSSSIPGTHTKEGVNHLLLMRAHTQWSGPFFLSLSCSNGYRYLAKISVWLDRQCVWHISSHADFPVSEVMRAYLQQLRQETGLRLCEKVFDPQNDKPSKVSLLPCCLLSHRSLLSQEHSLLPNLEGSAMQVHCPTLTNEQIPVMHRVCVWGM